MHQNVGGGLAPRSLLRGAALVSLLGLAMLVGGCFEDVVIDETAPDNVASFSATAGDGRIELSWANPSDNDFAGVVIRRSLTAYPVSKNDGNFVYDGADISVPDSGLSNGNTYFFTAFAYDESGNTGDGSQASPTPVDPIAPDTTASAAVAALALEIQVGQLIQSWSNPADADFTGVTIRRSTTEFPATPSDGQLVYEGTKTTFSDGLVMDGATYNFSVFAHDSVPNYSSAAQVHILAGLATTIETCTICHAPDRTVGHNVMHGLEVHYAEPWPTGWRWETAATP